MNKLDKAKEIIKTIYKVADLGIFNTTGEDMTETVYEDDGLSINVCYYYSYLEVFGLSDTEFKELKKYYNSLEREESK
jgi:hypothetical protein